MDNYLNQVKFQYYFSDIKSCKPIGKLSLRQFIESHKNPKQEIVELFTKISDAAAKGDLKLKNELKKKLFYFTPSVTVDGWRNYDSIIGYNNIVQLDFDGITWAEEFRDELFNKLECVICAYCSPSKLGVKALVRIDECNSIKDCKSYIYGLFHYLQYYIGHDTATKNVVLPLYLSMDKDIKWRDNPSVWSIRGYQENEFDIDFIDSDFEPDEKLDEKSKEGAAQHIKNMIGRADVEQIGHKNVLNASLISGGYAAMYSNIDESKMLGYLLNLIDESEYLSKDVSGYKKTAQDMFNKGLLLPIKYNKN